MHIYSFNDLKFTLKHLKRCYMFRYGYSLKTLSDFLNVTM